MRYKHALFLNPYAVRKSKSATIYRLFPPTGLEYVASSAKDYVVKLTLLDLRYEEELSDTNSLLEFIRKEIDIICVGIAWDREFDQICDLLNLMPDNIPLIVGGHKATEQVEELFERCPKVNIIVRGEGEETIREIALDLPLEKILGISYRNNGAVIHNANRPLPDVDIIEAPDRNLRRNQYRIYLYGRAITNLTFDTVLSARGCRFNCKFCTFNLNPLGQKRGYSERNVESVVDEIASLEADIVLFSDDNFVTNVKRAEKICDSIIERKIKKHFIAQVRIEIGNSPQLLDKMVKAGFKMLAFGIESPHDRILASFNKGFNSDKIRKAFKALNRYPIFYHGYFIYGNIGETEQEMLYIAEFAKQIRVDTIACNKLRAYKFSPVMEIVNNTPGYHVTDKGDVYSDTYSPKELRKINKKMRASYYTPFTLFRIAKKLCMARLIPFKVIGASLACVPNVLKNEFTRKIKKILSKNT
jgi:anaerobic magnesium-protoporphyrin IX monomethyl ester cyclase